ELIYFGSRALTEIVAAHLLVLGCYLLEPGYPVSSRRRRFAAGLLFGLVCYLRVHLAPAVFIIVIWSLWRGWRQRFPALLAGAFQPCSRQRSSLSPCIRASRTRNTGSSTRRCSCSRSWPAPGLPRWCSGSQPG